MDKKNVLFIISALTMGGAENSLVKLLPYIKDDYNIDVLLLSKKGYWINKLPKEVNLLYLYDPREKWKFNKFLKYILKIRTILHKGTLYVCRYSNIYYIIMRKIKIKKNYDVEISYLEPKPVQFLVTAPKNTKKIHYVRNSIINDMRLSMPRWYLKNCEESFRKVDKFLCVSGDAEEELNKMYQFSKGKSKTIDNLFEFDNLRSKARKDVNSVYKSEGINVVTVGRFSSQKGFLKLVRAHKKLIDAGYKHNLHIIGRYKTKNDRNYGDGDKVLNFISENKLRGSISLHGEIDNPYPYIDQADIYVSSSNFEGFPRAISEALILNTPVVATNVSGTAYALNYGDYGMLISNDVRGLYEGLKELICSEKTRIEYRRRTENFCDKKTEIIGKIREEI